MPNLYELIPKTPLKQLNWLLLIPNYAKCENIGISICGNLRIPKTLSAEEFHLFPCLGWTYNLLNFPSLSYRLKSHGSTKNMNIYVCSW